MENEHLHANENAYLGSYRERINSAVSPDNLLLECKTEFENNSMAVKLLNSCKLVLESNEHLTRPSKEKSILAFENGFALAYGVLISTENGLSDNTELRISFLNVASELMSNVDSSAKPGYRHELLPEAQEVIMHMSEEGYWDVPGLEDLANELSETGLVTPLYREYFRGGVGMIGKAYYYFLHEKSLEDRHLDTEKTEFGKLFKKAEWLVSRRTGPLSSIRESLILLARTSGEIDDRFTRDYLPHIVATGLASGYAAGSILYDSGDLDETRAQTGLVLMNSSDFIEDLATSPDDSRRNYRHLSQITETFLADKSELHNELVEQHKRIYLKSPQDVKIDSQLQKIFMVSASVGAKIFSDALELRRYTGFVKNDFAFDERIRELVYTSKRKQLGGENMDSDD